MQDQAATLDGTPPDFTGGEGLRALLNRLHTAGPGAWRRDAEARALIEFCFEKYRRLAVKWGRDPADAAAAAYSAMLGEWVRVARDPWAQVTVAVQRELRAEAAAEHLMISTAKARRRDETDYPRPVRASEHEEFLYDILAIDPAEEQNETSSPTARHTAMLLVALGWPEDMAEPAVDYIITRLTTLGDRGRAYDSLRRDESALAQLDISRAAWTRLLRLLIGGPSQPGRATRRGIIVRLLLGEAVSDLLRDDALVLEVGAAAARRRR